MNNKGKESFSRFFTLDMGVHRRAGEEEYGDSIYLQKNSTTVQRATNTLSNKAKWQPGVNNSNDIRRTHLTNYNSAGCDMLHIFDELSYEEKSEEKKEEKIEGKKGKKKEKKKRKEKKEKMLGPHGTRGIFLSAPGSVSELVEHPRTSQQFPNTSNIDKFVLDDKSQKSNSSLLRSISHSPEKGEQRPLDCDSTGLRFEHIPERSERSDNAKNRRMGLWELRRDQSLDLPNQVETEYSDKNAHNRCENEKKEASLSKLRELPDYLREQLNKNNHWEFHQITEKDSLDFVDSEYFSYLNEKFDIKSAQPIFIDHSGYVIWILDEDDHMYEWNEMERGLKYLGKDLIEGLTNFFIYPDNICEVMEDTGERIPVKEFKLKMKEKAKEIWDDRIILNINYYK
ncbi:hypothetical protein GLOIN_2v1731132 [Rhizophagus irregularis DAOM 181602=DAOM 197198]|uniref:Uncharacterized protein n=2 Tax=Rhizophagus irregularis TaxID=588596 RepID=A0A015JU76_RHIIW|nr:hypothetical protein GLOIN_2v1731132 [Rhizophagus irregularis DAOM 181602=DAOM 197198]EXX70890.1 hypothetical protein RirG_083380 [Rhizophagus irregularis DAOM 197198w]POG58398.1 hypothetical protein GLOIN_2v1731132 [Rhizophagus irregularis DAOM 181602=DAOM 197198]|eukprot:XP_025165264.1 hypothetical protein GLOIN_2v1731132 [Rhizophagus irregularis DAOM 181602=DAOM 197198]